MAERFTFLLAVVGYAGLTVTALLAARGRLPVGLWRITAAIIVAHVTLVWSVRYGWSWAQATRHGYAGAVIFHGALLLVVTSVFAGNRTATRLIAVSFVVVTLGALGAVFRYDEVAVYRPVVIGLAAVGGVGLASTRLRLRPGI
jgi:hypothetical protein